MVRNRLLLGIVLLLTMLFFSLQTAYADEVIFAEDFEAGWGNWYADNGIWEVDTPTAGPSGAHGGSQCAGTVLGGTYPPNADSRLISPSIQLPEVSGNEEIHLCFWHWFSYKAYEKGYVQIKVWDETTGLWGDWVKVSGDIVNTSPIWSRMCVDLTTYAGQKVRIAFYHTASDPYPGAPESWGWYIDNIEVIIKVPEFTGDFELGWGNWYADNGIWEVDTPTAGPSGAHGGSQCAGTVLGGTYPPNADSRLISPSIQLPEVSGNEEIHLCFWHWFSYKAYEKGYVQIKVWDETTGLWGDWVKVSGDIVNTSPIWSRMCVDLTTYAGQKVRIAFYHTASDPYPGAPESWGWYIDNIQFHGISPVIDSISFIRYIFPPLCASSTITVTAHDPCDGNLIYNWDAPDGGDIIGTGAEVEFVPPEEPEPPDNPYRVTVSVTSDRTHISSFVKVIKIYTKVLKDYDFDEDIDGSDLAEFAADPDDLARFAEEFGMVACQ